MTLNLASSGRTASPFILSRRQLPSGRTPISSVARQPQFPYHQGTSRAHQQHHQGLALTTGSRNKLQTMAGASAEGTQDDGQRVGVLFVCLGNICRSPTAEAMFRAVVKNAGLEDKFDIDSCGTGGGNPDWYLKGGWSYHEGDESDRRMSQIAKKRGVMLTSRSRPLQPLDLNRFQYIIGMEDKNMRAMMKAINYWRDLYDIPEDYMSRLSLMTQYCTKYEVNAVPDPYYARGEQEEHAAFNRVLDLLEDACIGLLEHIRKGKQL